jgi:D-arabinose 1-dehydrogenase-like Zn-dependent alcohol dehydrogenase
MLSYQLVKYGQALEQSDTPRPNPVGTEVLLEVDACGVCHSDLHLRDGFFDMGGDKRLDLSKGRALPLTLGHEIAGRVVACGADATGVDIGAPRVVYPWIGCGECHTCAAGEEHLCPRSRALGVSTHGGFSECVLVPHPRYLLEYGDRPVTLACTYACSGLTAYGAVRKVQSRVAGRPLVIIGLGGVGFAALRLAQAVTTANVVAVDVNEAPLEAAAQTGAVVVDARADDAAKQIRALTGGGAAAAIDFVGAGATASLGFKALGTGGLLVIVGLFGGQLEASIPLWPLRSLTVQGSYVGSLDEMRELMRLVASGVVSPIPIRPRPLSDAQAVLNDLRDGGSVGRMVLTPQVAPLG